MTTSLPAEVRSCLRSWLSGRATTADCGKRVAVACGGATETIVDMGKQSMKVAAKTTVLANGGGKNIENSVASAMVAVGGVAVSVIGDAVGRAAVRAALESKFWKQHPTPQDAIPAAYAYFGLSQYLNTVVSDSVLSEAYERKRCDILATTNNRIGRREQDEEVALMDTYMEVIRWHQEEVVRPQAAKMGSSFCSDSIFATLFGKPRSATQQSTTTPTTPAPQQQQQAQPEQTAPPSMFSSFSNLFQPVSSSPAGVAASRRPPPPSPARSMSSVYPASGARPPPPFPPRRTASVSGLTGSSKVRSVAAKEAAGVAGAVGGAGARVARAAIRELRK